MLPAELILAEHVRLGSTAAILSRTFHRQAETVAEIRGEMEFGLEIAKLRAAYAQHLGADAEQLQDIHLEVSRRIHQIAAMIGSAATGSTARG